MSWLAVTFTTQEINSLRQYSSLMTVLWDQPHDAQRRKKKASHGCSGRTCIIILCIFIYFSVSSLSLFPLGRWYLVSGREEPRAKMPGRRKQNMKITCALVSNRRFIFNFCYLLEASVRLGHKSLRTLMKRSSSWYLPGESKDLISDSLSRCVSLVMALPPTP